MAEQPRDGLNRRDVIKKGAMVGGALVWTTPVVQSLAGPALAAQGSLAPETCVIFLSVGTVGGVPANPVCYQGMSVQCCSALDAANAISDPAARAAALAAATFGSCFEFLFKTPINCPAA